MQLRVNTFGLDRSPRQFIQTIEHEFRICRGAPVYGALPFHQCYRGLQNCLARLNRLLRLDKQTHAVQVNLCASLSFVQELGFKHIDEETRGRVKNHRLGSKPLDGSGQIESKGDAHCSLRKVCCPFSKAHQRGNQIAHIFSVFRNNFEPEAKLLQEAEGPDIFLLGAVALQFFLALCPFDVLSQHFDVNVGMGQRGLRLQFKQERNQTLRGPQNVPNFNINSPFHVKR
mmetsp:Transcript_19206/g.28353  ORF Transcript_19206/g.28353 Transcript_19206/m.28353 type:complete len:229 (-) Transcript_19206:559-1245(-)